MNGKFLSALIALYVGLGGVALACLYLLEGMVAAVVAFAIPLVFGVLASRLGQRAFWRRPQEALYWTEISVLAPATVAAAISAALFVVSIHIPEWLPGGLVAAGTSTEDIGAAITTAMGAFAGAIILKAASEADDDWIAPRVEMAFQDHYRPRLPGPQPLDPDIYYFDPATDRRLADAIGGGVVDGKAGWGYAARRARATIIALSLIHI